LFDFDNDGQVEIVLQDSSDLYILNAATGEILFTTPNGSATWIEYPSIADVDNDGHADIVSPNYAGVRVFQHAKNNWAPTRGIWNQHSYHITNINDDGSIPRVQQNPTTFHRQQQFEGPPLGTPDLTAGYLQIIDNGIGQPVTLQVRIGNAGLAPSTANLALTFYAGDPTQNGTELGTVTLDSFEPGTYQDVQLTNVDSSYLNQEIYAIVDASNALEECNEDNNSIAFSLVRGGETTLAQLELEVVTDAPNYGPNMPVTIDYTVTNQGALPAEFQLELRLEDSNGQTVAILNTPTLETLVGGETNTRNLVWNTETTLAGHYQLHLLLLSAEGDLITETTQDLVIDAGDGPVLALNLTTDKPSYHTTDVVQIKTLLQNQSLNVLIDDGLLSLTVKRPNQQVLQVENRAIQSLPVNGLLEVLSPYMLQTAALGTYTIEIEMLGYDGTTLDTDATTFQVTEALHLSLVGEVETQLAQLTRGQVQQCNETVTNTGTQTVSDLKVQYLLVNIETQATIAMETATLDLVPGDSQTQTLTYHTLSLPVAHYACVLQAQLNEQWQILDFKTFNLHEILSSECSTVYAIHDQKRADTQLFTYNLNDNTLKPLGPLYPEHDLEGMDIHPYNHHLYASAGNNQPLLYQIDGYTGDLTPLGPIGFADVVALSFDKLGNLWGWSKSGLIQLNLNNGQGELVFAHRLPIEGIAWNNAGTLLYGAAISTSQPTSTLWVYDPQQQTLTPQCDNLPGEVESLEILPDDHLAFGIHDDNQLSFHVYDISQCQTINNAKIVTPFNDIEAIAWPTADCTTQQQALRAFFTALSTSDNIFLGEDGNLRVPLDDQIYQGQLAESITQGTATGELQLTPIPDANQDGTDDFLVSYPDGKQQTLYFLGLTED
jgi:hypothetical protein